MPEHVKDCPFCPEKMRGREVFFKAHHWFGILNRKGYVNTQKHILIVPYRHLTSIEYMGPEEWEELKRHIEWCRCTYGEGMVVWRLGGEERTGSTVPHLHVHFIVAEAGKTVQINCGPDSRYSKGLPQG